MSTRFRLRLTAGLLAVTAGTLPAQSSEPQGDLLLRINAPITIGAAESVSTVWVIAGDVQVDGTVRNQVIVMGGAARVNGAVQGGIAVFNGSLELGPMARVSGDIDLYGSTMIRREGAIVGGRIDSNRRMTLGPGVALGFWLGTSLVVVVFGLLLAMVVGGGLNRGADVLQQRPGAAVVTGLVVWAGVPLVVALAFATVIGIPLGIATMAFLMPTLGFLGYVVSGTALGRVLWRERESSGSERPYRELASGLLVLQLVGMVPVLGFLVMLSAAVVGSGAILYRTWTGMRGTPVATFTPLPAH